MSGAGVNNPTDIVALQADVTAIIADLVTIEQETYEIEHHLHNRERWFGKSADQSGNNWGTQASLTPYRAISGNNDFGQDGGDYAKVIGTDDTPAITGMAIFDAHRILITASSKSTDWILRIIYGASTMVAEEALGNYSDVMVQEARKGAPIDIIMPRCACVTRKLWVRAKNVTDNATIDFFIGIHEYER